MSTWSPFPALWSLALLASVYCTCHCARWRDVSSFPSPCRVYNVTVVEFFPVVTDNVGDVGGQRTHTFSQSTRTRVRSHLPIGLMHSTERLSRYTVHDAVRKKLDENFQRIIANSQNLAPRCCVSARSILKHRA